MNKATESVMSNATKTIPPEFKINLVAEVVDPPIPKPRPIPRSMKQFITGATLATYALAFVLVVFGFKMIMDFIEKTPI